MRVLMLTQTLDESGVLGFTRRWAKELARRVERLYCIVLEKREEINNLEGVEVLSLGKERGYKYFTDIHYLANLYRYLSRIEKKGGIEVIFSHMLPVFTIAVFPYAFLKKIPIVQWYTHPCLDIKLKIAHCFARCIVTTLPTTYPYKMNKVKVVGHGIDTEMFSPGPCNKEDFNNLILCVGRISPVKDQATLIRAAGILSRKANINFKVVFIGSPITEKDRVYMENLKELIEKESLKNLVSFRGAVKYGEELVEWYRRCFFHVNLTPTGSGDKTALESMACGKPTLVANEGFRKTLGKYADQLIFKFHSPEDLAEKMERLFSLSKREQEKLGNFLRERIEKFHSLDRLMEKLKEIFEEVKRKN